MLRQLLFVLAAVAASGQPAVEFFEAKVRPVLVKSCQSCHNAESATAGLDLSSGEGLRKGADTGPVIAPEWEKSRLLGVISYEEETKMPPTGRLAAAEIAAIRQWVKDGAVWPEAAAQRKKEAKGPDARARHWAFQPLRSGPLPNVKDAAWARTPIDRFLLARMEAKGLRPAPPADRRTLLRRAAFDLTGLPPGEVEMRAFLADSEPGAFARAVDRLLASPRYGEKWGRHWLDVARYADSTGADEDYRYPHAWRYRDYVIDAFNRDLPYAQFLREQIAGDLLPPTPGEEVNARGIVATGFLALGPKLVAEQDKLKMFYDIVDEQIDVTGKAFLGLTISCARCHDHKFDPVTIRDYYSLASIFASTKQLEQIEGTVSKLFYAPIGGKAETERYLEHQKKIAAKQAEIDAQIGGEARRYREALIPKMSAYMTAARSVYADGVPAANAASKAGLDTGVVERWAAYLKPTRERRPHLEDWYRDADAAAYQSRYEREKARREKETAEHKAAAAGAKARGEEPPPAPKYPAGLDRFFTEVSAAKGPLGLPEKEPELLFPESVRAALVRLRAEKRALESSAPPEPPFACGVMEDKPVEQAVFLRGNPRALGPKVPKQVPVVLAGSEQPPVRSGSGRLELADWLASGQHPLPWRVMVNRIWQGHFGQGIVRSTNNFGLAGDRPSHPELLDWLAAEFQKNGGSVKAMHRLILNTAAYQMSGEAVGDARTKDADNVLLTRFPMRRKTVEEIRDSLLAIDDQLDFTMGGALATGTGTDNEFSDGRKSMHPDATRRRTVYLPLRRSNLATLLTLFDFGDATTSTESRESTNVAPLALYMMNSRFVAARATGLAAGLWRDADSDSVRVQRAWEAVLGREPSGEESRNAIAYVGRFPKTPQTEGPPLGWVSLCRALIASNEFLYIP